MQNCEILNGAIIYVIDVKSWKSGVSDTRPAERYDMNSLRFDVYKVLLFDYFYCPIYPRNPANLNTRSSLQPCVLP